MSTTDRFSPVFDLPRQDIRLDPSRFQGRQGEYSEDTVNAIVSGGRFDPTVSSLVVWKDPDSGQYFLLSGHSRFEAAKRLYESGKQPGLTSLPVKELLNATEEEAVEYATIESNRRGTEEGLVSDLKAYALAVSSGKNSTQLKRLFRPDSRLRKLQELSYLNPKGMFVEYLAQPSQQSFPYLERNARWVGDMRRQLPALTNAHERELFDYLYGSKKALNLDKSKFYDLVNNKVNRIDFDPDKALNLNDRISPTAYTDPINEQLRELDRDIDVAQKEIETRRSAIARARGEGIEVPKYQGRQTFEERIAELNAHIIRLIEKKEALRQASGKLERTMGGDLFSQVEETPKPVTKVVEKANDGIREFDFSKEKRKLPLSAAAKAALAANDLTLAISYSYPHSGHSKKIGLPDSGVWSVAFMLGETSDFAHKYFAPFKTALEAKEWADANLKQYRWSQRWNNLDAVDREKAKRKIHDAPVKGTVPISVVKKAVAAVSKPDSITPKVMLVTRQYGNPIYITANPEDEQFGFTGTDDENEAVTWESTGSNYKELAEVLKRAKFVTGWDGLTFEAAYMHPDHGLHVVNTDMVSNMVEPPKITIRHNPSTSPETRKMAKKAVKSVKDLRDPKSPHIFKKGDRVEHVNPTDSWLKHKGVVTGTVIETGYAKIGQDKGWIKLVKVLFDDNSTVELEEEDFKAINGKADTPRTYKLGDMWSADFDTDGMLRAAYNVPSMPRKDQELLYNSLSDNNYHSIAKTLWEAMAAFDNGDKDEAHRLLLETRAEAGDVIDDMNVEDACPPTRDGKPDITPAGLRGLQLCINHEGDTANRHKDHGGHYTAERMRVHQAIVDEFRNQKPCIAAPKKPIAVLTGGAPGSGKSHFLKGFAPWLNGNKVLHIDADEVRAKLPEYKGWNADNTHTETSHIVNMMLDSIGTPCKHDLVYDGTMNKAKKYLPLVERLKKMGYEVLVIYMQVPKDVSMARVMERYQRTGRYVPQHVIDEVYANGLEAYEAVIKAAAGYIRVDGVTGKILEKGGKPIPSEREYDDEPCCEGCAEKDGTPCEDTAKAKKIKLAKAFAFAAKARAKLLQLK